MRWYVADKDYVKYLHGIDPKVEEIDYADSVKPYLGIILDIGGFTYYMPVSSPKPHKHMKMKNGKDFLKLIDPDSGQLIVVLNINNMIPVPPEYVTELDYGAVEKYKTFATAADKQKYIDLLRKELALIKSMATRIQENAAYLHAHYKRYPDDRLSSRCCNFTKLEEGSKNYKP